MTTTADPTTADRPWLAAYPAGVDAEIDPDRYASLVDLLHECFARYGDAPAFENRGTELGFAEIDAESRALAGYLAGVAKLAPGDRVAVMLPNLLQSPVVIFAALRAGLVVVNVNPLYTAHELEHLLVDSGAKAVVVLENFAGTVAKVVGAGGASKHAVETIVITRIGDHFPAPKRWLVNFVVKHVKRLVPPYALPRQTAYRDALALGRGAAFTDAAPRAEDLAFLQYTGGTTGRSKGAMLTHRNMVSNVLQSTAWVGPFLARASGDVITALPIYHVFALTVNLLAFVELGRRNVLVTNPRDVADFVAVLKRTRFSFMTGVNTLFNVLLHAPGFDEIDFSALKVCLGGGMAVQRDVAERWQQATGVVIAQGYGLTETSPVVSASALDATAFDGSVGLPFPSTDVAILDEAHAPLPIGEIGEIAVKGPQVMAGYWQSPDETAATFTADGWLLTGDVGRLDERGRLYIEDRKKDMIIVSGFNVYPNEVEDVVTSHPGVLEAAVIGVPNEESGESVKAFVVRKDPALTAAAVIEHCRGQLTAYKVPDAVEFRDELPKSNVGKVLRRELR